MVASILRRWSSSSAGEAKDILTPDRASHHGICLRILTQSCNSSLQSSPTARPSARFGGLLDMIPLIDCFREVRLHRSPVNRILARRHGAMCGVKEGRRKRGLLYLTRAGGREDRRRHAETRRFYAHVFVVSSCQHGCLRQVFGTDGYKQQTYVSSTAFGRTARHSHDLFDICFW